MCKYTYSLFKGGLLFLLSCGWLLTNQMNAQETPVPSMMGFQARITVNGSPFTGTGNFKFALVDATGATTLWSHDNTSIAGKEPTSSVKLPVFSGLVSALVGDTTITGMRPIPARTLSAADVRLRIWFNDGVSGFELLTPDQRLAPVPFALVSDVSNVANAVADNSITASKLAASAVTAPKIAPGAVDNSKLAPNSVTSPTIVDGEVATADLAAAAVTSAKLADLSVTTTKLVDASVTGIKLANASVSTDKLTDGTVTNPKLANSSVTQEKLADGSISNTKLGTNAVTSAKIAPGAVDNSKLAPNSVTSPTILDGEVATADLAAGAVTSAKIADLSVITTKLADASVTAAKLANASVSTDKLTDGTVTNPKLANSSVTQEKLADGSVANTKIANSAVTSTKIAAGAVDNSKLAPNSVTSSIIADGEVTTADLAAGAVTSAKLADLSIGTAKLADASVTGTKLVNGSITQEKLADGSINNAKLADASITSAKVADGAIGGSKLAPGSVGSSQLALGTVTSAHLSAGAVTTDKIADGSIITAKIADGAVTSSKLGAGAVGSAQIAPGAVNGMHIAAGSIGSSQLAPGLLATGGAAGLRSGIVDLSSLSFKARVSFSPDRPLFGSSFSVLFDPPFSTVPEVLLSFESLDPIRAQKTTMSVTSKSASGFEGYIVLDAEQTDLAILDTFPIPDPNGDKLSRFLSLTTIGGVPAIAYPVTGIELRFIRALDPAGATWDSSRVVDNTGAVGAYCSLAEIDGRPAVAYADESRGTVKFARANDATGSAWSQPIEVGQFPSTNSQIAGLVVANGRPAICFYGTSMSFVRALDSAGAAWSTPVTVSTVSGPVLTGPSVAIVAGRPAISYCVGSSVNYIRADNADGSSWPATPVVVRQNTAVLQPEERTSLAVIGGNPAIGYSGNLFVEFVKALDSTGASWGTGTIFQLAFRAFPAFEPRLVDIDGAVLMAYRSNTWVMEYSGPNFTRHYTTRSGSRGSFANVAGCPALVTTQFGLTFERFLTEPLAPGAHKVVWLATSP